MVKHVLKDGTVLDDIEGFVITREMMPELYRFIEQKMGDSYEKGESKRIS